LRQIDKQNGIFLTRNGIAREFPAWIRLVDLSWNYSIVAQPQLTFKIVSNQPT
jgi:UDP-N-acetyl-D-mannosaminuronic acid transferase (WecB/TagA/CpsF family)